MEDTGRPVIAMGRGRARSRARSPTRPATTSGRSPTRSFGNLDAGSSSSSSGAGTTSDSAGIVKSMETLGLRSSSSSHSVGESTEAPVSTLQDESTRGAKRGLRTDVDFIVSRPEGKEKTGKKGTIISMKANYYEVKTAPTWALYEYRVDFSPNEDKTFVRKKLFKKAAAETAFGYIFDGTVLYTSKVLEADDGEQPKAVMFNVESKEGVPHEIIVRPVGKLDTGSPVFVSIYNLLLRKCMFALGLEEMGRNFFNPEAAIELPTQRLSLWPGYVTSIRHHEEKMLLCVETTHKVLRLDSVLLLIKNLERTHGNNKVAFQKAVATELANTIVMTTYNRKTYHVDSVVFDKNPRSTFEFRKEMTSLVDYYKDKYQQVIQDLNQPLLMAKPSKKDFHRGDTGSILLVPELCQFTGLTDGMRANFSLMKELSKYLHQGPQEKATLLNNFLRRMVDNPTVKTELTNWGLQFDTKLVELKGRILPREVMTFAKGTHPVDDKGDFTMAFRSQQMLSAVDLSTWAIIVPQRDLAGVDNLVRTMTKVVNPLSMKVANPKQIIKVTDARTQSYLQALEDVLKIQNLQMIFVILPNNKAELYNAVKKRLAVDVGVPSQCFLAKNVASKGLMSIATKVVVQMNAKLGGEPWTLKLPLKSTMFVGFDVYHGAKGSKGGSVGAMVATFSSNFTKYFSTTSIFNSNEELSSTIQADMIKCCHNYQDVNNGELPERIIMYRDGVGEGQLKVVFDSELAALSKGLEGLYASAGRAAPGLTYIVVTKRINTRLMMMKMNLPNPPPGTIVDEVVTFPERYDFYLISCAARQGTVSPCCYNVLQDDNNFDADKLQLITFKMCHMYYNWSGTIAVPAPCQYAHKLAFLTGMSYAGQANSKLRRLLHFL